MATREGPRGPKEEKTPLPTARGQGQMPDDTEVDAAARETIDQLRAVVASRGSSVIIDGDEKNAPTVHLSDGYLAGTPESLAAAKASRRKTGAKTVAGEVAVLPGQQLVSDPGKNYPKVRTKPE